VVKLFANGIFGNGSCLGVEVRIDPRGFDQISCDAWVSCSPCFADVSEIRSWVIRRVICGVGPSGEPLLGREGTRFSGGAVRTKVVSRGMFLVFHRVVPAVSNSGKNMHLTHACSLFRV
jgi:hypothetical protein